jgi:preprotein translocase subunit SecA
MIRQTIENIVGAYASEHSKPDEWDITSIEKELSDVCGADAIGILHSADLKKRGDLVERCIAFATRQRSKKEAELTEQNIDIREVERIVLLRAVDTNWMDQIDAMDQLKQGIGLRAYAQTDPANAYSSEGADLFDAMIERIREEAVKNLLHVQVRRAPIERKEVAKPVDTPAPDGDKPKVLKRAAKIGRNDPCPCGSGKKYKNCCGRNA